MAADSYSVTSEELRTFAGTLDARGDELRGSCDVVRGVPTGVMTFGIIGQAFGAKVRTELDKTADRLTEGAESIDKSATAVRESARAYDDVDAANQETFAGGSF